MVRQRHLPLKPTPPRPTYPSHLQCWTLVHAISPEFQHCIGWGRGVGQQCNFQKDSSAFWKLQKNTDNSWHYISVPRMFSHHCSKARSRKKILNWTFSNKTHCTTVNVKKIVTANKSRKQRSRESSEPSETSDPLKVASPSKVLEVLFLRNSLFHSVKELGITNFITLFGPRKKRPLGSNDPQSLLIPKAFESLW